MKGAAFALLLSVSFIPLAHAQDDREELEAEMFGDSDDQETREVQLFDGSEDERAREADLFGDSDTPTSSDASGLEPTREQDRELSALRSRMEQRLDEQQNPLALGGQLFLRLEYAALEEQAFEDQRISSPNLLDVYLDARPNERIRAYARGRMRHDFTRSDGVASNNAPQTTGTGTLDTSADQTSVLLDQLWLKFDLARTVYVTAGRQPVRWGTGRFWNPTDFLNRQFRDPLAVFDERLGVGLVKVHLPIESLGWNFYAVANFEGASRVDELGGALRAELLVDETEVSVTAAGRSGRPLQLGVDLSSSLWEFDVYAEAAFLYDDPGPYFRLAQPDEETPVEEALGGVGALLGLEVPDGLRAVPVDRRDEWIVQASVGAEIQLAYSAQDSVFVGAEYFYFNVGQTSAAIYPSLFLENAFVPLYTGQHYAAVFAALPNPGSWNRSTFSVSTIGNLSDRSYLSRLDFSTDLLTFATFNAYVSVNWGHVGEFRYRFSVESLDVDQLGGSDVVDAFLGSLPPEQAAFASLFVDGLQIDAPRFNMGVGIRMAL